MRRTCGRPACNRCRRLRQGLIAALGEHRGAFPARADVARHAGVPAEAFDLHYATVDDCLLDALDEAAERLCHEAERAFDGEGAWHECVWRAVSGTLAEFAAHPGLRWLFFEEIADAPHPELAERRVAARARYAGVFANAFEPHEGDHVPEVGFEFLIGAGYRAVREGMLAGTQRDIARAAARAGQLTTLITTPRR